MASSDSEDYQDHDRDAAHSAPTSPLVDIPSSPVAHFSPPTSPRPTGEPSTATPSPSYSTSQSSSNGSPPQKRRKYQSSEVSRSTLQRRLYQREDEEREAREEECDAVNFTADIAPHATQNHDDTTLVPEAHDSENEDFEDHIALAVSASSGSDCTDSAGDDAAQSESCHESDNSSDSPNSQCENGESVEDCSSTSEGSIQNSVYWLYQGSPISVNEAILKILKLYIKERWTKTSLDSNVKLIKSLLPQPNDLPTSGAMLLNKLQEVAPFQVEIEHYYCAKCQSSLSSQTDKCNCGCEESNVFLEYPIEPQVRYFFEHRDLASVIDRYKNRVCQDGCISDILDGSEYIKIRVEVNGQYDIVLILNVDGVSLSKSSKQEVWPILCFICEVPPALRPSFVILCGVYVGKSAPKMNTYLKPFVNSIQKISRSGGVRWVHPHTQQPHCSNVTCPILCTDAPATAKALNVKQHSHRYGCNVCEQKATKVALTTEEAALNQQLPARKRKRPVRRFVFQEDARLRTGPRMKLLGHLAEERGKPRKGVIGPTVLSDLPYFDPALCICAEYLHGICLGVVKYFFKLLFYVRGPWYIGDKLNEIDLFISSIKVPDFIKRLPRGMSDLKFLIGSELRAFLLFYSLPAFKEHMKPEYFQHWMLLVGAIFILLQEYISEHDLRVAELMLRLFVREIHVLYSDKYMTYNVHNLLHLCLLVRRWGNLWASSAFDFEKFNGFIVSHVHGSKHIGKELLNNIKIIQSVQVFEGIVNAAKLNDFHRLPGQQTVGKQISCEELSGGEREAITQAGISLYKLFRRAKLHCHLYTSILYDKDKKRSNSFVQFCPDGADTSHCKYGQIVCFVEDCENRSLHCLIHLFEVKHTKIIFHEDTRTRIKHLIPVKICDEITVIPLTQLVTKVIKAGDYLCLRPNPYEVNL